MLSESALRHHAKRAGLLIRKSRARRRHVNDHGGYRLVDPFQNAVVAGERFDLTLIDLADLLTG